MKTDEKPEYGVGDTITYEDQEYTVDALYHDPAYGWMVDYTDEGGKKLTGYPTVWFELKKKINKPVAGQTAQEIEQDTWDKCDTCGRTLEFRGLGFTCVSHGPKKLKLEKE